ncbi:mCG1027873 [Mus musculus]|nr:mCG1027873 [Mus musculus]
MDFMHNVTFVHYRKKTSEIQRNIYIVHKDISRHRCQNHGTWLH